MNSENDYAQKPNKPGFATGIYGVARSIFVHQTRFLRPGLCETNRIYHCGSEAIKAVAASLGNGLAKK